MNEENISQLFRYFTVTKARIAILTNGIHYRFFSDLDEKNKMDARPFLDLNMQNIRENLLDEVRKLAKERFDLDRMLSTANELKYTSAIKKTLSSQVEKPDDEFVRFFFKATNSGSHFTATAKEQFAVFVQKAFQQFIRESVSDRLRSALQKEDDKEKKTEEQEELAQNDNGIVTTEEELEGFQIVRAIICQKVKPNRIAHRDTKSYFGILLDDNNRKPICRLYFNTAQKYIGLFDKDKKETKQPINELTDIYRYTEQLLEAACCYDGG